MLPSAGPAVASMNFSGPNQVTYLELLLPVYAPSASTENFTGPFFRRHQLLRPSDTNHTFTGT
jgi:hypothetical protein